MIPRTEPAKIVIFSTVHQAMDDRIFHKEARSLAQAAHNVVIIASHPKEERIDDVHIKPLWKARSRLERMLRGTSLLPSLLRERGTIYHFHDPELILVGLLLRLLGKKAIYDSHEDMPKDMLLKKYVPVSLRPILSGLARLFETWAGRILSAVIVPSEDYSPHIRSRVVVHNYPILDYVCPAVKVRGDVQSRHPFLVYCGTMTAVRGASEMLKSAEIASEHVPVRLRLIGPIGDERLRAEIASAEQKGLVEYLGEIPHRDVYGYCTGAVAGLLLYHSSPFHQFIVPIKLFELMACEVPVIASDLPFFHKTVYDQGCGLVVNPLDVQAVADAIIYLVEHPQEARRMGERGRELVRTKYNWKSESKKLLALYEHLLAKGSRRSRRREKVVQQV